jgi:hypothetical protein
MSPVVTGIVSKIVLAVVMPVITVVFALAILLFIWGTAGLIINREDPDKRVESQRHILWGVIGIFIMIASYGIIRFVANTIGVPSPF